jgi:hypothetical protein
VISFCAEKWTHALFTTALVVFLTCSTAVQSQVSSATISGRVTLRGAAEGLVGVSLEIEGSTATARSDSSGRYVIRNAPRGPQVLLARRIGYASARTPIIVPETGTLVVDVVLATNALQLEQLVVTADRTGRARGELGTASVIDRAAIANQSTSSLQGVLELLPGVPLQPPGLDAAAQFSLRAIAQTGGGAGDVGAAGTLIILDGVPLSNNANLQSAGIRGGAPSGSTAGGGIDLRRIPASTLERVEVIRGIPSVRWGDLTQGAIIVDTRAAATLPEFTARFDPRTSEANIVGGQGWSSDRQAITATFNVAETQAARTLSSATTMRGAAQLAHRYRSNDESSATPPKLTLDTRVDWWTLRFDDPERVEIEPGRNTFQDDWGLRIGERARWSLGAGQLEWTTSVDIQAQRTDETRRLSRSAAPFTDRVTEGRHIGTFVEGIYDAASALDGAPRLIYSRLEYAKPELTGKLGAWLSQFRTGVELRREWNDGAGFAFDIERPPQVSGFTGVNGYDRPRRFDATPALVTSAAYADVRLFGRVLGMSYELQPGLRIDAMHGGQWWASGVRSTSIQPRVTGDLTVREWLSVRGGIGRVGKLPTIGQLYPAPQYYDVVNVNRYTPDPRERLAVLTTFIKDPTNTALGLSQGLKQEIGFELRGGAKYGALSATWFDDLVTGVVAVRRQPMTLLRDRYALVDTALGSGQPGRIVDPPISADPVPIFLDQYVNSARLGSRGVEVTASLPVIAPLRTRLEVSGASMRTRYATNDRDFGNVITLSNFQVDSGVPRIAYFEGRSNRADQGIVTWRLIHHQPDLGLVITGTLQQRIGFERATTGRTDSLSFEGYITRTGELVPVPESDRLLPEYSDLRRARAGTGATTSSQPDDWLFSLQVAKSIGRNGRLSFYVFNALDKLATFGGGTVRTLPSSRFGVEVTLPLDAFRGAPQ